MDIAFVDVMVCWWNAKRQEAMTLPPIVTKTEFRFRSIRQKGAPQGEAVHVTGVNGKVEPFKREVFPQPTKSERIPEKLVRADRDESIHTWVASQEIGARFINKTGDVCCRERASEHFDERREEEEIAKTPILAHDEDTFYLALLKRCSIESIRPHKRGQQGYEAALSQSLKDLAESHILHINFPDQPP